MLCIYQNAGIYAQRDGFPAYSDVNFLAHSTPFVAACPGETETLGYIGPRSLPALLGIMTNPSAPSRYMTTVIVGKLGTNALPAVPILLDLLVDPDSALRKAATSLRKNAPEFLTNSLSAP